jgi:hypothetical protein
MNQNELDRKSEIKFMKAATGLPWRTCNDVFGITAQGEFFKFWLIKIKNFERIHPEGGYNLYNFTYSDIFDTHSHPAPVTLAEAAKLVNSKEVRNIIPLAQVEEISNGWRDQLQAKIDGPCVETAFSADVVPKNLISVR